jgi:hypothetical protein
MISPQQARHLLTRLRKPVRLHDEFDKSVALAFEYVTKRDLDAMGITVKQLEDAPGYDGIETIATGGGYHLTGFVFERGAVEIYAGLSVRGVGI